VAIAFAVHRTEPTLCSRFLGTVTPAELGRYMALLQNDPRLRAGMTHFVDCRDAQSMVGSRPAADVGVDLGPLTVRFSVVAIIATSGVAMLLARQVQDLLRTSSDRCTIYGSPDEAWQALRTATAHA
jgi:hypothetical protein